MPLGEIETIDRGDGLQLAFERIAGRGPTFVFLCGFHSEMNGTKGAYLARWAADTGRAFLRMDYSGHGRSGGRFDDGTIGRWRDDALAVIDAASDGSLVLIGSSMGGWMALLTALARPQRVQALLLIAPAPDFTEALLWKDLPEDAKREIMSQGQWLRPSAYEAPYPITRALIEEGRNHLLLGKPIPFAGKVRILQGQADPDVPWRHALALANDLTTADLVFTLIKDGDHRLSRPQDLARLIATAEELSPPREGRGQGVA